MDQLPPSRTPLNQHSLEALESWLKKLGAERSESDICLWYWVMPKWSAEIKVEKESLRVSWDKDGKKKYCSFPYGLSRKDVQSAIFEGP